MIRAIEGGWGLAPDWDNMAADAELFQTFLAKVVPGTSPRMLCSQVPVQQQTSWPYDWIAAYWPLSPLPVIYGSDRPLTRGETITCEWDVPGSPGFAYCGKVKHQVAFNQLPPGGMDDLAPRRYYYALTAD